MAGGRTPAGLIDQGLGMFDPEPHGEGLAFHRHAEAMQHGEGVTGTVAHRQGHLIGSNITRVAFKRGAYLRHFVYAFAELLSERLTRTLIEKAMAERPGSTATSYEL
jgi:LysR family cys regulon transcriptional activator